MKRTPHPQRAVHRPDKPVRLRTTDPHTGDPLTLEGPLLRCLNAASPALDAGLTVTITPLNPKKETRP